ncbi:TonB-dependent siderophore receptor [Variovorax arabinosiphilus]|uniref:TonB-dependent siderophore receptor n=1 Tax=Variovorax arabinosiphilus TaxID=3053498 RepID=UPI0025758832|nr:MULTISPECIES: TonB-dependent siderophore receptor [unclassified Variovorax]MDM0123308.1 TonB-dependent siderophore receptor [Variovorax sp. J2L1-78]MDM0131696.1 TonB-dependent siderophore receptor [Variovorax sp. J2L1-63]MDM0236071.1 TonB-dependent siderophore receptor [Variovorax sp. J2R1-6]
MPHPRTLNRPSASTSRVPDPATRRLSLCAIALACGTALAALANAGAAMAQERAAVSVPFLQLALPSQPLSQTLNTLSRQFGVAIGAEGSLLGGKMAPALQGRLTLQQALDQALTSSGLIAVRSGPATMSIQRALEPSATGSTLPQVTVTAALDRETAVGPVAGYVAKRSATGSKTDTPILETPQSISVVTSDELRNRQAETLSQALNYTPGFTSQPTSFNRTADRFRIRGMDVESATSGSLRDGLRLQSNSYDGIQEPFGLERVEVLRGAASVLYGQLSPGGVINAISKRPTSTPLRELNVQLGNHDRRQISADFSGPVPGSDTLDYRLTMLGRDSNTAQNHINDDKLYIAPSLTWRPNADTSLTLLSFYQKTDTRFSAPLPYQLVEGIGSGPFRIGRSDFIGEPSYDKMKGEMLALGYELEHRINDSTRLSHKLRYFESDVAWNYLQAQTSTATLRTASTRGILQRQYSDRRERAEGLASDTHLETKQSLFGAEHTLLIGVDAYKTSYDSRNFRGNAPSLNLGTYAYGQPVVVNRSSSLDRGSRIDTTQKGIYLQDQIQLNDRWTVLLGARHDWADQDQTLRRNQARTGQSNEASTWRAGLVYKTAFGLAPYVSYSESFFPVSVADAGGAQFKPTGGKQYEAGVRYQPEGSNMLASAAVYELTQTDVLKYDAGQDTYRQAGEVRSRGFELEAKAELTSALSVIASYAYTDARITRSTIASEIGQRSEDTPYHQAALWVDYSFAQFGLPQLTVGAGARYKGSTQASGIAMPMPAYTLLDAMLSYRIDRHWNLVANLTNLTNKKFTYCEFAICRYGDERQLTSTLTYRW